MINGNSSNPFNQNPSPLKNILPSVNYKSLNFKDRQSKPLLSHYNNNPNIQNNDQNKR